MIKLNIEKIFGDCFYFCNLIGLCVDTMVLYIIKYYSYRCIYDKALSTWLNNSVYLGFIFKDIVLKKKKTHLEISVQFNEGQ